MTRSIRLLLVASLLLVSGSPLIAARNTVANLHPAAEAIPEKKVQLQVQEALREFEEAAQLRSFFSNSYGVALFPPVGKGGLAIFTKAKGGFMYEASVGGQKFSYRPVK